MDREIITLSDIHRWREVFSILEEGKLQVRLHDGSWQDTDEINITAPPKSYRARPTIEVIWVVRDGPQVAVFNTKPSTALTHLEIKKYYLAPDQS
jgi:hypothetical protein